MKRTEQEVRRAIRVTLKPFMPKLKEQWRMEEQEDELDLDLNLDPAPEAGGEEADIEVAVDEPSEEEVVAEPEVEVEDEVGVPEGFPAEGIQTVIEAMVNMGITSAIRDMSDDLAGSYPELEDLSLDIQLRLLQTLADPNTVAEAAREIAELVKFGRENLISDVEEE